MICRNVTSGEIVDLGKTGCNRNGHYSLFAAVGKGCVSVDISIEKA